MKRIVVQPMKCAGCRTCEMVCSITHYGVCSPLWSHIRVVEWQDLGLTVPMTCMQCEDPLCMKVCPVKGISRDAATGAVVVNENCIGCRMCLLACPFGAPSININTGRMIKCDLCGGDPQCVKYCPTGALEFVELSDQTMDRKRDGAGALISDQLMRLKQFAEQTSEVL